MTVASNRLRRAYAQADALAAQAIVDRAFDERQALRDAEPISGVFLVAARISGGRRRARRVRVG